MSLQVYGLFKGPFLCSGFSAFNLQESGHFSEVIGRMHELEVGSAKTFTPSLKKIPDRLPKTFASDTCFGYLEYFLK